MPTGAFANMCTEDSKPLAMFTEIDAKARTTSGPDLALQGHQSRGPAGPGFVGLAKSRSPSGPGSVGLGKKRDPRAKGQGWPWVCNGQIDKKGKFSL